MTSGNAELTAGAWTMTDYPECSGAGPCTPPRMNPALLERNGPTLTESCPSGNNTHKLTQ